MKEIHKHNCTKAEKNCSLLLLMESNGAGLWRGVGKSQVLKGGGRIELATTKEYGI